MTLLEISGLIAIFISLVVVITGGLLKKIKIITAGIVLVTITTLVFVAVSVIRIVKTETNPEEKYKILLDNFNKSKIELEKFFVEYPEFKEIEK